MLVSQTYYSVHSVFRVIVAYLMGNIYQHLDKLWLLFNCHNQTYTECVCPEDFSKFSGVKTDWHSMFIASWPVIMGQMRLQTPYLLFLALSVRRNITETVMSFDVLLCS